jgi:pyruvate dehydrogenase E1 component alpha subunit
MKIFNKKKLVDFENKVAELFNLGKIKSPVHLYSGNENKILRIFKNIKKNKDWVFCSWRSHYQCLLKGVPENILIKDIIKGRSISLCYNKFKIYSSAIVGGHIPIAVGTAMALKRNKTKSKVYCFMGDITSETGIAHESIKFSINHKLPIKFIIEDNNLSVCTDTRKTWKINKLSVSSFSRRYVQIYTYKNKYPHSGAGKRVQF